MADKLVGTTSSAKKATTLDATMVALICGSCIMLLSLGIRHGFGLFLKPVTLEHGWGRETFAFALATQNLAWGVSQPFFGMLADKYGGGRVIVAGAALYVTGLLLMAGASSEIGFIVSGGLLIGLGQSGTTYPVIFGVISRRISPDRRSMAMGITMAVSSFGQFIMLPITLGLIESLSWHGALVALSIIAALMLVLSIGLREPRHVQSVEGKRTSARQALSEAFASRDFWLLAFGFAACGFQVVFIAVHLPAFLADNGIDPSVATTVLALIGLVNIAGTYFAGLWGGVRSKPMLLVWVYVGRAAVIAAFVLLPISTYTAYAFGILMGLFWLSTVPLTSGTVATIWGAQHMSMLGGIVFLVHQLGGFAGGWFGGWLYDHTGSYNIAWAIAIVLSLIAAMLNYPIKEISAAQKLAKEAA